MLHQLSSAVNVVGGVGVYTLTAGTGTAISTSTGAVTIWNTYILPIASTSTLGGVKVDGTSIGINSSTGVISALATPVVSSTTSTAITVDLSNSVMFIYTPSTNANVTITLVNFTAGKIIRMFITPTGNAQTFTFTGVTGGQTSNGTNSFVLKRPGGYTGIIAEIFCTTSAVSGVYNSTTNGQ